MTGSQQSTENNSKIYKRPGQAISGALTYAIAEINNNPDILPNHSLDFIIAETYGKESESIKETVLLLHKNISVYIGPQETCIHEGRIAASFNLPMISYFCSENEVSDKELYPTFARTKPTVSQISKSVVSILRLFNWKKVTFIHSNIDEFEHTADTICDQLESYGITVRFRKVYQGPYFHTHSENPFIKIVSETKLDTRIYVMLGAYYEFIGLMDHLQDTGLLDAGEYFVVGVHVGVYDLNKPQNFLQGIFQNNVTRRAAAAFRHFVGVVHSPPIFPDYDHFEKIVNKFLESPPFNYTNPYKHLKVMKQIKPEAAYLYDAVWLYAKAVDKILSSNGDIKNGELIINSIKGMTYKSAMGYISRINAVGDAEGNFSLVARRPVQGAPGEWGLLPIGVFRLSENLTELPSFHYYDGETIKWIAGSPPVDEPACGYRHEKCIPPKTYTREVLGGVAGGVMLVTAIIGYLIYRNWRYEQDLASLLWKIEYKDLSFGDHYMQTFHGGRSKPNGLSKTASQISLISQVDLDLRQLFTHVGTYRGTIVAIRIVNKKHVELTRNVRKELKIMRELRHDNIIPFIGACIDSPNILVITAYCGKGSLQDILENEDLQLDSMFIASLVFDMIRGMMYLHSSEIKSHGKLKSSNCVVDSRWVLKIADFGLHEFLSGQEEDLGEYAKYRNLLWRAPELLRSKTTVHRGTQEGDVYSFGIIMFEIQGRMGPFGNIDLSPKEIIERVKFPKEDIEFRPRLSELSSTPKFITDVIKECWDEDPVKRPDFAIIRSKLKPMQKGMKANIFDNMLAIMEKYADSLEALVEDRTDQLIQEKKKTEELLHQMLPSSVADQLMSGKQVEAEAFESVTIYFSDICGFTAMSSESTPMQVVGLLNDLYTLFDSIIEYYDVYKVETIGDAYMVVSGLPKPNGINHAGEIASMSLHLLEAIGKFKIRHRPDDKLKLRIGVHSGTCVAGVVGLKMPRFCLFGDTVNTASRMESHGEALKIHCSQQVKDHLDNLGGYDVMERGVVNMKGKGEQITYWIVGEDIEKRRRRFQNVTHSSAVPLFIGGSFQKRRIRDKRLSGGLDSREDSPDVQRSDKMTCNGSLTGTPSGSNLLQPNGFFVGPSSAELLRRSSSRRRRLKFTIGGDDEPHDAKADYYKANCHVIESTPLISRRCDEGEENMTYPPKCTSCV
ncbi:hypothetical protein SNE40_019184 [Patella caerulea]|uniref:Guanylate cyclase n=2 Tax=Patella caerulea TaxID=87958 RepID=A0AAN8J659_PATCE